MERRWVWFAALAVALLAVGVAGLELAFPPGEPRASVTVVDADGRPLGSLRVRVADSAAERYVGLSETDTLGPNEGMLFVHDREGEYAYVMRRMAFPIDIIFIDANRTITAIHHAEVEPPPLTRYRGRGRWVLEAPYRWTDEHGIRSGHRVRIDRAD